MLVLAVSMLALEHTEERVQVSGESLILDPVQAAVIGPSCSSVGHVNSDVRTGSPSPSQLLEV